MPRGIRPLEQAVIDRAIRFFHRYFQANHPSATCRTITDRIQPVHQPLGLVLPGAEQSAPARNLSLVRITSDALDGWTASCNFSNPLALKSGTWHGTTISAMSSLQHYLRAAYSTVRLRDRNTIRRACASRAIIASWPPPSPPNAARFRPTAVFKEPQSRDSDPQGVRPHTLAALRINRTISAHCGTRGRVDSVNAADRIR